MIEKDKRSNFRNYLLFAMMKNDAFTIYYLFFQRTLNFLLVLRGSRYIVFRKYYRLQTFIPPHFKASLHRIYDSINSINWVISRVQYTIMGLESKAITHSDEIEIQWSHSTAKERTVIHWNSQWWMWEATINMDSVGTKRAVTLNYWKVRFFSPCEKVSNSSTSKQKATCFRKAQTMRWGYGEPNQ